MKTPPITTPTQRPPLVDTPNSDASTASGPGASRGESRRLRSTLAAVASVAAFMLSAATSHAYWGHRVPAVACWPTHSNLTSINNGPAVANLDQASARVLVCPVFNDLNLANNTTTNLFVDFDDTSASTAIHAYVCQTSSYTSSSQSCSTAVYSSNGTGGSTTSSVSYDGEGYLDLDLGGMTSVWTSERYATVYVSLPPKDPDTPPSTINGYYHNDL